MGAYPGVGACPVTTPYSKIDLLVRVCFAESSLEVVHLMLEFSLLLLGGKVTVVLSRLNCLLHVQEGGVVRKLMMLLFWIINPEILAGNKFSGLSLEFHTCMCGDPVPNHQIYLQRQFGIHLISANISGYTVKLICTYMYRYYERHN